MEKRVEAVLELVASVEGWLTPEEGEFLYRTARECTGRGAIVEIGSWKGKSTICLARGSEAGRKIPVYAIDPHTGAPEHHVRFGTKDIWTFDEFRRNIGRAGVESLVRPIVERSEVAARVWERPVEFLWIDGAHAYEEAKLDCDSWFPHLMEGGIIAYHDSTFGEVQQVVKKYILHSRHFKDTGIVDTITFATKVHPSRQTMKDRVRNRYISLLSAAHGMRRIPLPRALRKGVKRIFKNALRSAQ